MRIFPPLHKIGSRIAIALVIGIAAMPHAAVANDIQEASKLFKAGQYELALARVNKVIAAQPKDPEARFLKGLILTEQGKSKEAAEVFLKMTEDYPTLPEPYNNLAVIYASQGEYEKARLALEKSIHTHPSYATAYENLGDVYARLASQAYDKALQLDSRNTAAQGKLALARDLVGGAPRPAAQEVAAVASAQPAAAQPRKEAPPTQAAAGQVAVAPPPPVSALPVSPPKPAAQEVKVAAAAPRPAPAKKDTVDIVGEVTKALNGWAQAWSRKDVETYLAHYAKDFIPPKGESRSKWEQTRRARVTAPKFISVKLSAVKVTPSGATSATATFRQQYQSDIFTGSSRKALVFVKNDGRWQIKQENVK